MKHIAIIGAGPAGCALACFLHQRGLRVSVFDNDKKPDLLVGESLLPAVMPILRRLEIEEEVAAISTVKRGAALRHGDGTRVDFEFQQFGREFPNYAYNIPRPQFDQIVRTRAERLGVTFVNHHAHLLSDHDSTERQVYLCGESLKAAGLSNAEHPDLVVDASGRARLISRLLKIPSRRGPRNDIAHFAHFKNFSADSNLPGQVVISVLEHGWSWQIPLRDRTSVGVVINQNAAALYGSSAAERLNCAIESNPQLKLAGAHREQLSPAMTYANYQLISEQAGGPGWALLGDALGFVDPMLSPGVFMALISASLLDQKLFSAPANQPHDYASALASYYQELDDWHQGWSKLIDYFYDGRMLAMGQQRDAIRSANRFSLSRVAEPIISRSLAQMVGGIATRSKFNQQALYHSCRHLITEPTLLEQLAIQSGEHVGLERVA